MSSAQVEEFVFIGEQKASSGMKKSLSHLVNLLKCPLCNELFDQPTTLSSCAHTFCVSCIDEYCCDSWVCPVEGCRMPMSIVGGHGGSYRKINPQLAQTVDSVKLICQKLNNCEDDWWKTVSKQYTIKTTDDRGAFSDVEESQQNNNNEGNESDEEMVDLQAGDKSLSQDYMSGEEDDNYEDEETQ